MVVSNILYFHPYLGKIPMLTIFLQMGWNHQLEDMFPKGTACQLSVLAHQPKQVGQEVGLSSDSHTLQAMSLVLQKMNKKNACGFWCRGMWVIDLNSKWMSWTCFSFSSYYFGAKQKWKFGGHVPICLNMYKAAKQSPKTGSNNNHNKQDHFKPCTIMRI